MRSRNISCYLNSMRVSMFTNASLIPDVFLSAMIYNLIPVDIVSQNEAFDKACFEISGRDQEFLPIAFSFGEGESIPGEVVAQYDNWFLVKSDEGYSILIVCPMDVDACMLILLDECSREQLQEEAASFDDERWAIIGSRLALVHKYFPHMKE